MLRHSVPHALPNFQAIVCWVVELSTMLCLISRREKWKWLIPSSGNQTYNLRVQSHTASATNILCYTNINTCRTYLRFGSHVKADATIDLCLIRRYYLYWTMYFEVISKQQGHIVFWFCFAFALFYLYAIGQPAPRWLWVRSEVGEVKYLKKRSIILKLILQSVEQL